MCVCVFLSSNIIYNYRESSTRPGGVWYTDSSEKTHSSLRDMLLEGLDVLIVAHFRGFSGGVTDMYQGILKQGSGIVETLVELGKCRELEGPKRRKQKVLVYVPPYAELRGGAWVVIDRNIVHSEGGEQGTGKISMEVWVDETCSAGILETIGVMGLKYRDKDVMMTAKRLEKDSPLTNGKNIGLWNL